MPDILPFVHVTDMVSGSGPFSRRNGWTPDHTNRLLSECSALAIEAIKRRLLQSLSCTVLLDDYRSVFNEFPETTPHVIDTSAAWIIGSAAICDDREFMDEGLAVVYDRNEKCGGAIKDRWCKGRSSFPWNKIVDVTFANSRLIPGVQFADLLAWSINNVYLGNVIGDWQTRFEGSPRTHKLWLDEGRLRNPNRQGLESFLRLRIPRRKPIR